MRETPNQESCRYEAARIPLIIYSMNEIEIVVGTGHRPDKVGGYGSSTEITLYNVAYDWLKTNRPEYVVSGMALGWDWALAIAALNLGIKLIAAIPFKGQELRWPPDRQTQYHDILRRAHGVVIVCVGEYAAWKMQRRNEFMVDYLEGKKGTLLALWDGTDGGTANCIKYFTKKYPGRDYVNLYNQLKCAC